MEDTDVTTATAPTPDSAPAGAVLAAPDGSPADGPILDWAADEAARLGAQLRLVTAVDPGIQLTPYDAIVTGAPSLSEQLEADAQRLLEAAAERVRARHPGLHVATSAPWGPAAASVVRMAEGARLVVVGAPARGLLERILLGSVALPVVAHAPCPAAVIPADTEVMPPRAIVVGVDGSERSGRAVALAAEMAAASGAALTAVIAWHLEVVDGVVVTEPGTPRWDAVEQRYAARAHQVVDPVAARHPGVTMDVRVVHGTAPVALHDVADELDADRVVVGSRGVGGFRGLLLGSVSRRVVEKAGRVVVVSR